MCATLEEKEEAKSRDALLVVQLNPDSFWSAVRASPRWPKSAKMPLRQGEATKILKLEFNTAAGSVSSREVASLPTPDTGQGWQGRSIIPAPQSLIPSPSCSCPVNGQISWERGIFHLSQCPLLSGEKSAQPWCRGERAGCQSR